MPRGISCETYSSRVVTITWYFGFSDREENLPVDEDTVFPLCSISEFITAVCIMKEHEQGLLDIDKPADPYLKQWNLIEPLRRQS